MSLALWGRMLLEQANVSQPSSAASSAVVVKLIDHCVAHQVWQQGEITADGTQREAQPFVYVAVPGRFLRSF